MSGLEASLLLGSVHSVALAIALRRRERNRRANAYLAVLLGALYADARDGWYAIPGGMFRYGIQGGVTFGDNDVVLRAGQQRDIAGELPLFPFYATLGYDRRW